MTRTRRLVAALVLVATLAIWAGPAVAAQPVISEPVTFGTPTASATFGQSIEFRQPATLSEPAARTEILVTWPDSLGPVVTEEPAPSRDGAVTLEHALPTGGGDGHVVPNTTLTARWRVALDDGREFVGPPVTIVYGDTRFDWQTTSGDLVTVHWYEGDAAFGRQALQIGEQAVAETAELLGVTEAERIDFFLYADGDSFREALGPATGENVGGQAHADIRTMFALVGASEIDDPWVSTVVPHELVHLVFDTAVDNPYNEPPHWLNEGLAVYLSEGYTSSYRQMVEGVAADGSIIPLSGLSGAFPEGRRFVQGYAESVSAVDYLVREHGRDALVELIRSYASGVTDDEAFLSAVGVDAAGFETAWLADLKAVPATKHGPQPAPAGPLPAAWGQAVGGSPAPIASGQPAASAPTATADQPAEDQSADVIVPAIGVVGGLVVLAMAGLVIFRTSRSRRLGDAGDPPGPA